MALRNDDEVLMGLDGETHRIQVQVPASFASLRLLRLVAADTASDAGMSIERIERTGVAVDELASLLIAEGDGEQLELEVERSGTQVSIRGRLGCSLDAAPELDDVASELVGLCVGDGTWQLGLEDRHLRFDVTVR